MTFDLTDEQVAALLAAVNVNIRAHEVWLGLHLTPEGRASSYQPEPEMVAAAGARAALLREVASMLGAE